MLLKVKDKTTLAYSVRSVRHRLPDGRETDIHIAKYNRGSTKARFVVFKRPDSLLNWCQQNEVSDAINAGFFSWENNIPLGETWVGGEIYNHTPFMDPWSKIRGCLDINDNYLQIAPRSQITRPRNMVQTGPILLSNGKVVLKETIDNEGFSTGSSQFDADLTMGRYPRTAIGYNDEFVWSIVCDGYSTKNAGLTLYELALFLKELGMRYALNLDGGGSSTLISSYRVVNSPFALEHYYPAGRPIHSAIIFEPFA
ncbi:phosphodiester glycosidase family protein [Candidatus Saccharibacteria bacterium]|nr:phosphodiester glycosidase family protein [Candidatus Saccharibacteria bacterium]